jgi:hypothetical protein
LRGTGTLARDEDGYLREIELDFLKSHYQRLSG